MIIQRFSEVPDQFGMAILSVIPGNLLLWTFLPQNFKLGIAKMSVTPENPAFLFIYCAQMYRAGLKVLHSKQIPHSEQL